MWVSSLNIYHPIQVTSTSLLQPMTTGHLVQSQSGMSWELNELPWFLLGWFSMFGNAFGFLPPNASWKILDSRLESLAFKHISLKKTTKGKNKKRSQQNPGWYLPRYTESFTVSSDNPQSVPMVNDRIHQPDFRKSIRYPWWCPSIAFGR